MRLLSPQGWRDSLKLVALLAMTIDHVNAALLDRGVESMTLIGRIAFPVFAFAAAAGALKTRNPRAYLTRLSICTIIAQPFFTLALQTSWAHLNTVYTLLCGVVAALAWRFGRAYLCPLALLAAWPGDYSIAGAALVLGAALMLERNDAVRLTGAVIALLASPLLWLTPAAHVIGLATVAAAFALLSRSEPSVRPAGRRNVFYVYYPLHLAVLWLIAALMGH